MKSKALWDAVQKSPGGRGHWGGPGGKRSHNPNRRDCWRNWMFIAKQFMEKDSRYFCLGSSKCHPGALRWGWYLLPAATAPAPASSLLGIRSSRELFLLSWACDTRGEGTSEKQCIVQSPDPSGKWYPTSYQAEKLSLLWEKQMVARKRAERQTQHLLRGLPFEPQRRQQIPCNIVKY